MKIQKLLHLKFLLSKCLLAGILFFSFITIAGYQINPKSVFGQNGQTELVYSHKSRGASKTGLYKKKLFREKQPTFLSHHNNLISLLIYNRLSKVKLTSHLKNQYLISLPERLFQINSIPQNSDKDNFSSFLS
jgi:hypothetical protein